jgi:hypothetical protein
VPVSFNSVHPKIARVGWGSFNDSIALFDHIKGLSLQGRAEIEVRLDPADLISCRTRGIVGKQRDASVDGRRISLFGGMT